VACYSHQLASAAPHSPCNTMRPNLGDLTTEVNSSITRRSARRSTTARVHRMWSPRFSGCEQAYDLSYDTVAMPSACSSSSWESGERTRAPRLRRTAQTADPGALNRRFLLHLRAVCRLGCELGAPKPCGRRQFSPWTPQDLSPIRTMSASAHGGQASERNEANEALRLTALGPIRGQTAIW